MGNYKSTRWKGHTRAICAEDCRRITPNEARHAGAETVEVSVAGTSAKRLYCRCKCGSRVTYLYQLPDDENGAWKCYACHKLTYRKAQMKGTRKAFAVWFTPERRERFAAVHPAREELVKWYGENFFRICAPYNYDRADEQQRAELLAQFGSEQVVRREYQRRCDAFLGRALPKKEAAIGQRIDADIWQAWKRRYRSSGK